MKKMIICIATIGLLSSCSSGWSCKSRYVKTENKKQTLQNTKEC
ncbi:hypothetical protein [Flavobacterium sp.]